MQTRLTPSSPRTTTNASYAPLYAFQNKPIVCPAEHNLKVTCILSTIPSSSLLRRHDSTVNLNSSHRLASHGQSPLPETGHEARLFTGLYRGNILTGSTHMPPPSIVFRVLDYTPHLFRNTLYRRLGATHPMGHLTDRHVPHWEIGDTRHRNCCKQSLECSSVPAAHLAAARIDCSPAIDVDDQKAWYRPTLQ